jgi:hypothetical protein
MRFLRREFEPLLMFQIFACALGAEARRNLSVWIKHRIARSRRRTATRRFRDCRGADSVLRAKSNLTESDFALKFLIKHDRLPALALRRIGLAFSSAFAQAPLGRKSIPTEAENALSAGTTPGQWATRIVSGLGAACALFFQLFLLGRSRNLHERGGGLGDLRFLRFRLLGFTVATHLTFRHRNSPLKRLAD